MCLYYIVMRYSLLINDLQTKVMPSIINASKITYNVNKLIHASNYLSKINSLFIAELYPTKLGPTTDKITISKNINIINKSNYSMVNDLLLNNLIDNNITNVILTGVETPWCIIQTTNELIRYNIKVHIPVDAVGSQSAFENTIALQRLNQLGAFTCTTNGIISELLDTNNKAAVKWYIDMHKTEKNNKSRIESNKDCIYYPKYIKDPMKQNYGLF